MNDLKSKVSTSAEEMADIIIMLCSIANRLDVNLETVFREKEKINHTRQWS